MTAAKENDESESTGKAATVFKNGDRLTKPVFLVDVTNIIQQFRFV